MATLSLSYFVSGYAAGICGLAVGHPLDTIKVRQQTFKTSNVLRIAYATFKHEGIKGFYRGMSFPLLMSGTMNSLFFGVYGNCLNNLQVIRHDREDESIRTPKYTDVFISASVAGIVQTFASCPVEVIKIKLQTQTGATWSTQYETGFRGPLQCALQINKDFGIKGLYRGLCINLLRDVPSFGIYMITYYKCLEMFTNPSDVLPVMVAGGMAGITSWGSIIPLDVIKSRIQSDSPQDPKYKGITDCVVKSYHSDGLKIFGRGFLIITLRAFPVNAATFLGFESCHKFCNDIITR